MTALNVLLLLKLISYAHVNYWCRIEAVQHQVQQNNRHRSTSKLTNQQTQEDDVINAERQGAALFGSATAQGTVATWTSRPEEALKETTTSNNLRQSSDDSNSEECLDEQERDRNALDLALNTSSSWCY